MSFKVEKNMIESPRAASVGKVRRRVNRFIELASNNDGSGDWFLKPPVSGLVEVTDHFDRIVARRVIQGSTGEVTSEGLHAYRRYMPELSTEQLAVETAAVVVTYPNDLRLTGANRKPYPSYRVEGSDTLYENDHEFGERFVWSRLPDPFSTTI